MILARIHEIYIEEAEPEKAGAKGYAAGDNPFGKIPALEWQPGQYLFDSPVICEYLDQLGAAPILSKDTHQHYLQKWQHALGDGVSDAVYNYRQETMRPGDLHWPEMIERHETAIASAMDTLESISDWLGGPWTYGNLAIICALDYASYRAGHLNWQERAPKLAAWHAGFKDDTAYSATYGFPA